MKKLCLLLIICSISALSANAEENPASEIKTDSNEINQILHDKRVGDDFIPISKFKDEPVDSYSFIVRNSITLHPYNKNIRVFTEIINAIPNQTKEVKEDEKKVSYKSLVVNQFANCDKMELAKGEIKIYDGYFGGGQLLDTSNMPNRWFKIDNRDEQRSLIVVACSLPLANQ